MRKPASFFLTAVAAAFLFCSWLWDALHPIVRAIVAWIPLEGVKRAIARFVDRLSPNQTLAVFLIPLIGAEPLKIVAVWFLARGQFALGVFVYAFAELTRYGLVAWLFTACRGKLLTIPWFARMYRWFIHVHEWAHGLVDPVKRRLKSRVAAIRERLRGAGSGALARRVAALRRLMARKPAA